MDMNVILVIGIKYLCLKAQHHLHFLRILKKKGLDSNLLLTFYHMSIESLRAYCFTVWYGRQEKASEGSQDGTEGCWLPSPLPDRHLSLPAEHMKSPRTAHALALDCLTFRSKGAATAASNQKPAGKKNSFFPREISTLN
ncbi:hypothetical protein ILYODFUR_038406 [Ilyodon furcidens]|uniref:Alkylated DNA repair protein AlkB homologue 8 N-terminal domain-containing protein n=1 Tax=Ilyodon furcidens TaxID=33524 RepID=A0ABV0V1I0_9TELE